MRVRSRAAATLLAGVLVFAACGDDTDDVATTTTSIGDQAASPASNEPGDRADGEPILVGFVNVEGGTLSLPEVRFGAEAAASHVNEQLGGVNGRPIEYVRCDTDGSPEGSIDCANQLIESGVAIVQLGIDPGNDAAMAIYSDADVPVIGNLTSGAALTASNAAWMGVPTPAFAVGPLTFYADQGLQKIRFFALDLPAPRAFDETVISPAADTLGLDYEAVFYSPGADWSVLAASAMADDPDVIGISAAPEPDCISMVAGLRAAGWDGPIYAGICSAFVAELPDESVGTTIVSTAWRIGDKESLPADRQEDADIYMRAMREAGHDELAETDSFATGGFLTTMNLRNMLLTIDGPIDSGSALSAIKGAVDFESFLGPVISCDGSAWPGTSACSNSLLFYEVDDGGEPALVGDGFVDLSGFASGG